MKIVLDAMGGDTAPDPQVAGAIRAAREYPIDLILVGQEARIRKALSGSRNVPSNISVVDAPEVVGMDEPPATAVRKKRNSSISIGLQLLRDKKAECFVSAGNTGAVVAASTLIGGLLPGVDRPGIAVLIPGVQRTTLMIDVGANIDPKPLHLLQYALMGEAYARWVLGTQRPTVGLLNVGEERSKGTEFIKEVHAKLGASGVNFIGNVEGHDIFSGEVDVIVCDGFAGNVALKTAESLAHSIKKTLRRSLQMNLMTRLGAFFAQQAFRNLRKELDYTENGGGATLMGVSGLTIIGHGGSGAKAIKGAIRVGYESRRHELTRHITESIQAHLDQVKG